jgi:hypothetical protein
MGQRSHIPDDSGGNIMGLKTFERLVHAEDELRHACCSRELN